MRYLAQTIIARLGVLFLAFPRILKSSNVDVNLYPIKTTTTLLSSLRGTNLLESSIEVKVTV